MSDSHLEQLRRRVELNPASPAFAALAEECRKSGLFDEAIATARSGLERMPTYHSARVTLGRALIATGDLEEARHHLETVVDQAPENLAAIRALADLHHRLGEGDEEPAPDLPDLPEAPGASDASDIGAPVDDMAALDTALDTVKESPPPPPDLADLAPVNAEPESGLPDDNPDAALAALEALIGGPPSSPETDPEALDAAPLTEPPSPPPFGEPPLDDDPRVVAGLERLLDAILRLRASGPG